MDVRKLINRGRDVKYNIAKPFIRKDLWTAEEVCSTLGVPVPEGLRPDKRFSMLCCFEGVFLKDSLFFQYDHYGDWEARNAMKNGAAAILCSEQIEDYPCIVVPDVMDALQKLGEVMYQRVRIPATVVTGSIGKTSTKYFLNSVYKTTYRVFSNPTNGNSPYYLGFELQRIDRRAEAFVQEVNESDFRSTSVFSKVLHPHIALITNMDRSHIGELGSEENIIRTISQIADGMGPNDYVVTNGDDPNSESVSFLPNRIRVGIRNPEADCRAENIVVKEGTTEFDLDFMGERTHVTLPIEGAHNVYNASMAFVAGKLNGISTEKILRGLMNYRPLGYRQNTYRAGETVIYADCYNSSAKSVAAAIDVMNRKNRRPGEKKIAVLGDIAEIEGYEDETYASIADTLRGSDIDILFTYGSDSERILKGLKDSAIKACHFGSEKELVSHLREELKKGKTATILFKASRSMYLETVIRKVFPTAYIKGMLPIWKEYLAWTIKTL